MAISKIIPLECGLDSRYHRIMAISVRYDTDGLNPGVTGPLVTMDLGHYTTKAARNTGARPVRTSTVTFVASGDIQDFLAPLYRALNQNEALGYAGGTED